MFIRSGEKKQCNQNYHLFLYKYFILDILQLLKETKYS